MKKHIFGLAIFSFIVGAAAIVYAMFNVGKVEEVFVITNNQNYPMPKSCWKMKHESKKSSIGEPMLKQAVFSVKTKKLAWELAQSRIDNFPILHFFVKDEKGVRLLDSIHTVKYFTDANATKFSNQYLELRKLSPQANLYLIPDTTVYSDEGETDRHIMFDIGKAIPVTVDYGK